ncbi:MAG: DUF1192 family protein [Kiloniellales bacterium]
MDIEDLEPEKETPPPKNLADMSIEELEAYIAELEAEIERVRADIEAKQARRGEAEALFRR